MNQEPTLKDVLHAVQNLAVKTEEGFVETHEMIHDLATSMDERFIELRGELKGDIGRVDERLMRVEAKLPSLVTKDYLDDKLADHHSALVIRMRAEDEKTLKTVKGWMGKV